ncbi:MAG: hypothetical protein WAO76_02925 [Georgfuchsia sp.]
MTNGTAVERTHMLNATPLSGCLDRDRVASILIDRPLMFTDTRVFVAQGHLDLMSAFVATMEKVAALPGWHDAVLTGAPATAMHETAAHGVFFGYDFHIDSDGPKLIEINTNAGGGPLSIQLLRAQKGDCSGLPDAEAIEQAIIAMFLGEWRASGSSGQPGLIAIVDDAPNAQYLNADFEMCRSLLEKYGIAAIICDAGELKIEGNELHCKGRRVDLVYNRLTDFFLDAPEHSALREAWISNAAVITPNPRCYALYADKRHLELLSDETWLASIGVDAIERALIHSIVPRTERVTAENADAMHAQRKHLFFKPATGYGSKAAYRGHNVTTRVFGEIVAAGNYVAQALVPPPHRVVMVDGMATELKFDLRCYAYRGEVLLTAARLWQGQTTNFRTPGGGFAPVVEVS